jgi:hypothetical protein
VIEVLLGSVVAVADTVLQVVSDFMIGTLRHSVLSPEQFDSAERREVPIMGNCTARSWLKINARPPMIDGPGVRPAWRWRRIRDSNS